MPAAEYSYEKLRVMSDNFREPVVVRGFYKDSPALKKWNPDYVSNLLGPYDVTVMQNSTLGKDHDLNCHKPWTEALLMSRLIQHMIHLRGRVHTFSPSQSFAQPQTLDLSKARIISIRLKIRVQAWLMVCRLKLLDHR